MEGDALLQLETVASGEDCERAVGMPDLHPGPGIPIGAAFAFRSTIHPRLVGSDAGCGALVVGLGKAKLTSSLERRIRAEFEQPPIPGHDSQELCREVWKHGPKALADFDISDTASYLGETLNDDDLMPSGELPSALYGAALGTIGGGNHFAEIGKVKTVVDKCAAEEMGAATKQRSTALPLGFSRTRQSAFGQMGSPEDPPRRCR